MIDTEELAALVPHKGKMFLLSRIASWDPAKHSLTAEFDITRDCLFFKNDLGGIPAWAGFELMAQSISALSGLVGREKGLPPQYGFILSLSEMILHAPVLSGTVSIVSEEETVMDNVYSFRSCVYTGTAKAVSAKLTVMEVSDILVVQR